ncbi:MAG: polyphosphate kinase 2 family protein [Bacteroidetes bacterium]|nr:polyphosphate kinase 2 family protein [Bacteroidota bacterium]MBU2586367.1 polyphosphate kinase 2 family protein [Bacteroidota bacterium]
MNNEFNIDKFLVREDQNVDLSKYDPKYTAEYIAKTDVKPLLKTNRKKLSQLQTKLYAQNEYALLLILQGMDASGKDGIIKNVMSGVNPQGCQVFSFKEPSKEELDHDYLWRIHKAIPERGRIGIFNRSHYEEVVIVQVHDLVRKQNLPANLITENIWRERYKQINDFEHYLYQNGVIMLKFYLHISPEEQMERFISRIDSESKNWKFSEKDIEERKYWNDYMKAYEDAFSYTSKEYAPWYIIPSDRKWFARFLVSEIIIRTLEKYNLSYPIIEDVRRAKLQQIKEQFLKDKESSQSKQ